MKQNSHPPTVGRYMALSCLVSAPASVWTSSADAADESNGILPLVLFRTPPME